MIDTEHDYLLIDEDGEGTLTDNIPDLSYCSFPTGFRISSLCNEVGYIIEKLNSNNEWEVMEVNSDK